MNKRILIAEDDSRIRSVVSDFLVLEGYDVIEAKDGNEALEAFKFDPSIKLIILDVMMPYLNGYEVCSSIRKSSSVPIIMLTAKTAESDELTGFTKGADEYISKPFKASILTARVNALYNRVYGNPEKEIIKRGIIQINLKSQEILVSDKPVKLSNTELTMLLYLIKNEKEVLSREKLLNNIWSYDYFGTDRTVDTVINRLRTKIKPANTYIRTIPKSGYTFELSEE